MRFLVEKNDSALLCFLEGFGIAVQVLVIRNIQIGN